MPRFVLIHSPLVGPRTWLPVAEHLRDLGHEVTAPSLLAVGDADPPFWPRVVAAVTDAISADAARAQEPAGTGQLAGGPVRAGADNAARADHAACADHAAGTQLGQAQPLVLVAHSNAGNFIPVIRRALAQPVRCSVFADARVPARRGAAPTAEEEFLAFLRGMTGPDGRLPRWIDWWPEEDLTPLFPDPRTRELVAAELPRLPLAYYTEQVPVPAGWDDAPCVYLHFSAAYDGEAQQAADRGWLVRKLPGEHLHQLVDPSGVATALLEFADQASTAHPAGMRPGKEPR
ncbi:MAG TPA: alpha/beta hydrolase [Streptosporangiaceae bacterium]|jgi:hypothetical protein